MDEAQIKALRHQLGELAKVLTLLTGVSEKTAQMLEELSAERGT